MVTIPTFNFSEVRGDLLQYVVTVSSLKDIIRNYRVFCAFKTSAALPDTDSSAIFLHSDTGGGITRMDYSLISSDAGVLDEGVSVPVNVLLTILPEATAGFAADVTLTGDVQVVRDAVDEQPKEVQTIARIIITLTQDWTRSTEYPMSGASLPPVLP